MGSAPRNGLQNPARGAASAQFPGKLHDLMTFTEREGLDNVISWVQNGRAILVHDPEKLLQILPHFGFSQTKYRSFQRQLNMWHWERILDGPFKGGWIHPYFIRGNKVLCSFMSRHGIPKLSILQVLMNSPNVMQTTTNMSATPIKESEKIDFPLIRINNDIVPSMEPLNTCKLRSTPMKVAEDDWEPLPTTTCDEDSSLLERQLLHFIEEPFDPLSFPQSGQMYEPTPIPEHAGMNQLLEPLSAEAFDAIF